MMEHIQFPSDWTICSFSDLVSNSFTGLVRSAKEQGFELNFKYLKMNNLDNGGSFSLEDLVRVDAEANEVERYSLEKGDFIFNTRNSFELVGKCGVFDIESHEPILFNNNLLKVEFIAIEPRIVARWLNSPLGKSDLRAITSATTSVAAIYQKQLFGLKLPLPPLSEQTVIIDKLDTLLTQVDTTKARLDRIPQILKTFRQSVLAAAISGKLTEEWRTKNCFKSIAVKHNSKLPKFSEDEHYIETVDGWSWLRLGSVVNLINGDRGKNYPNKNEYVDQGIPFINTGHINPDGTLSNERMNFISGAKFDSLGGGKTKPTDLVYCLRGATMGKTARVNYEFGAIASSLVIVRPTNNIHRDFAYYFLISPSAKKLISEFDNGSAQPNLSAKSLATFPLQLPPIEEQTEIVRRVDELFAFADRIEKKTAAALECVNNLTQAILAKAFRGELTADWRAANPDLISAGNSAEALLKKIKTEREALKKQPKKKAAVRIKA